MISEIPEIRNGQQVAVCICKRGHRFGVSWEYRKDPIYCPECGEKVEA